MTSSEDFESYESSIGKPQTDLLPPLIIAKDQLSPDALTGIIDAFVLQEGTDYGAHEVNHATKTQQVLTLIEDGEVYIVYDPNTESVTLMTPKEFETIEKQFISRQSQIP